jgi:DMSO/TMAO reductase YedYZ molybdopterin-dependent catalytic subunit
VIAVGSLAIALQPPGAKDVVVGLFGTNDKAALNVATIVVALLIGALAGVAARRSFGRAVVVFGVVGLLGFAGAWQALLVPAAPALVAAAIGVGASLVTLRALLPRQPAAPAVAEDPAPRFLRESDLRAAAVRASHGARRAQPMPDWGRRRFLVTTAGVVAAAAAAGTLGRLLLVTRRPPGPAVATSLPTPAQPALLLGADQSLSSPGVTPIVMPNDRFYRIDTALLVPQVDASTWQLKVDGLVSKPLTFGYADLLAMPLFEQYVTIACVSNVVGGNLVGNAKWTGVRLKAILAEAGIDPAATQIVGRSVDGFTVGFPTAWALDPVREPMIALGMNDVPLPAEHGYPARLIVPGLFGYVSATKWLAEIELTTIEAFDAYWVNLGWAKEGPILTQSRIDHPGSGDRLPVGPAWIDGIAWAPDRGVSRVEVRIDGGAWQPASLSRAISTATWVQWMVPWQATAGAHTIEVRATDGTGSVQTDAVSPPAPDGARGHDAVSVQVG